MGEEKYVEYGPDGAKRVVVGSADRTLNSETSRVIRKVMDIIEKYTNYNDLDDERKAIVRDTVLNQINRLGRVSRRRQTMIFDGDS